MAKLIIGMGLPAAGKTTALKKFAEKYGYKYISPDDLRKEAFGKVEYDISEKGAWKEKNEKVWEKTKERLKEILSKGDTVVFDAVFNNPKKRKEFIDAARESGVEKIEGIYIDIPLETSKERNLGRERQVPAQIIERIAEDFEESSPKLEEGFDGIFTLDEYQTLVSAEKKHGEGEITRRFK